MRKNLLFLAIMLSSLTAARLYLHAAPSPTPDAAPQVSIDNFMFAPQKLTVTVGTTVNWTNKDDVPHNVVDENGSFKSKTLDTDDTFSHTFDKQGTYKYYCAIHPKMQATVVVK